MDQHTSDARLGSLKAEKRLLEWQAADRIRSHIVGGKLRAGARLLETQLSEQLEVSRGTVRSALALLSREGLVQKVAFTRWQVSDTSVTDAWELYTLRGPLEGLAARLAAANVSEPAGAALRALGSELARAVEEKRLSDVTEIDFQLHKEIVALAHHARLARQHADLVQQLRFHMVQSGFLPKDYGELVREHEELIDAVVAGDASRAEELARKHNENEVQLLSEAVAKSAGKPRDEGGAAAAG